MCVNVCVFVCEKDFMGYEAKAGPYIHMLNSDICCTVISVVQNSN